MLGITVMETSTYHDILIGVGVGGMCVGLLICGIIGLITSAKDEKRRNADHLRAQQLIAEAYENGRKDQRFDYMMH